MFLPQHSVKATVQYFLSTHNTIFIKMTCKQRKLSTIKVAIAHGYFQRRFCGNFFFFIFYTHCNLLNIACIYRLYLIFWIVNKLAPTS